MKAVLAALAALQPALALACPVCAEGDRSDGVLLAVAAMIAAPYVIAAVVVRAIRSAGDEP